MQQIQFSRFQQKFSNHFQKATGEGVSVLVKRTGCGILLFRPRRDDENLEGIRKIVGPINSIQRQLPRIFDSIAVSQTSKRAFVLHEKTAILEWHKDPN